jgi:hypothetical protein
MAGRSVPAAWRSILIPPSGLYQLGIWMVSVGLIISDGPQGVMPLTYFLPKVGL